MNKSSPPAIVKNILLPYILMKQKFATKLKGLQLEISYVSYSRGVKEIGNWIYLRLANSLWGFC